MAYVPKNFWFDLARRGAGGSFDELARALETDRLDAESDRIEAKYPGLRAALRAGGGDVARDLIQSYRTHRRD